MRNLLMLLMIGGIFSIDAIAQSDAPAVQWKMNDIPPHNPVSPIMTPNDPGQQFQPGEDLLDPNHQYPTHKSGEDWWYSVTNDPISGGYYACGFATWINYDMSEINLTNPGCNEHVAGGPDLSRPVKLDETLSTKLATVALYSKEGEMVWCKAILQGDEGAFSCQTDSQGNLIITGWCRYTRAADGSILYLNPQNGLPGFDIASDPTLCAANSYKTFVAKISPNGDKLWANLYSMYDLGVGGLFGGSINDEELVALTSLGTDLVVINGDNIIIAGGQEPFGPSSSVNAFVLELASDGQIINRTEFGIAGHNVGLKAISKKGNGNYLVGGYATQIGAFKIHGFVASYSSNTLVPEHIGANLGFLGQEQKFSSMVINTPGSPLNTYNINANLIWIENIPDPSGTGNANVVQDMKELSNDNLAVASIEDCIGCTFSGNNIGIGRLRIYKADGTGLDPSVNGGNPIRLNTSESGSSIPNYVQAFDLKIGIEPTADDEITLITTVKDGTMFNDPDHTDPRDEFEASMLDISGNTTADSWEFIGNCSNCNNPNTITHYEPTYIPRDGSPSFKYNHAQTSALLANYTIDGELRWEKVIDIDDADLQEYPGDWKEQECVYQVIKDEDGAYIFVGNTSHNKDDYLIAKVYGNCQLDIDYDEEPVDPTVDNIIVIPPGPIVTWDQAYWNGQTEIDVRGEIHIPNGAVLQITDGLTVHFADGHQMVYDTKIVVEQGGRLIITNGATLTSNDCPGALWSGVEVWGDSDQPQYAIYQGTVTMTNNATIENAWDGVRLWKVDAWTKTGGIIRATNSHFHNNRRDVEFIDYDWELNNTPQANVSFFNNCTFITDDDLPHEDVNDHVTLFKVFGVRFIGCDFADYRTNPHHSNKGKGIVSMDARYSVLGKFTGTTPTVHDYFDETDYDLCTFTNLIGGVEAMDANSQNTISVDHSLFTDCRFGVRLSAVDNALITRNKFVETSASTLYASNYAILIQNSTAYQVEGNIVENTVVGGTGVLGITIDDSGLENNEVYKNILDKTHYGLYSFDLNRNGALVGSPNVEGLQFLCNTHMDNIIWDQLVYGFDSFDGERIVQGTFNSPTGNLLSSPNSGVDVQLMNFIDDDIYYYYDINGQMPTLISGFFLAGTNSSNTCPTQFNIINPGGGPVLNADARLNLENQFDVVAVEHSTKKAAYEALIDNGDRTELHDAVANLSPSNKVQVKNQLLAESPYLSESLLRELAIQAPGYFPNAWLKDIVIANIEVTRNADFMKFLVEKSNPVPVGLYNQIVSELGTYTERTIKQHEVLNLNVEKDRIANYILKDIVLPIEGVDYAEFNEWVTKRGDILCELQISDNYLDKGMKAECLNHLYAVDDQISLLAAGELKTELEFYRAFKTEMLDLTNENGVLEGLNEISEPRVRYYAENAIGIAQVQAQNLLCFFLEECADAPPIPEARGSIADPTEVSVQYKKTFLLSISPNPSNGQFTIAMSKFRQGEISIVDMNGRIVYQNTLESNYQQVNLSHLKAGVYLLQFLQDGVFVEMHKLIKK